MARSRKRSSTRSRLLAIAVLAGGLLLPLTAARAEIIVDDFDDSVLVASPQSDNHWATTNEVGPLDATRQVRIGWGQGDPDAQLDANISALSVLTGKVSRLNPRNELSKPIVSMQFDYSFSSADLSEGGINDTIFLDFLRLESEIPPSVLLILVNGTAHLDGPLLRSSTPFTIAIPFTSFSGRDGSPGLPDFTAIREMRFEIRASAYTGGGPDPLNFFMQLDRIRIGRVVPEPRTFAVAIFAVASAAFIRLRHDAVSRQYGGQYDVTAIPVLFARSSGRR